MKQPTTTSKISIASSNGTVLDDKTLADNFADLFCDITSNKQVNDNTFKERIKTVNSMLNVLAKWDFANDIRNADCTLTF